MFRTPVAASASNPIATPHHGGVLWSAPGSLFTDRVDAQWRASGARGLAAVTGPWAVVLHDAARDELVLACDPIGVQPLFWALTRRGDLVASSWLARLPPGSPTCDAALDYEGVLLIEGLELKDPRSGTAPRTGRSPRCPPAISCASTGTGGRPCASTGIRRTCPARMSPSPCRTAPSVLRAAIDHAVARLLPTATPTATPTRGPDPAHRDLPPSRDPRRYPTRRLRRRPPLRRPGLDGHRLPRRRAAARGRQSTAWPAMRGPRPCPDPALPGRRAGPPRRRARGQRHPCALRSAEGVAPWFQALDPTLYPDSTHVFESHVLPRAREDGVRVMLSGWGGDKLARLQRLRRDRAAAAARPGGQRVARGCAADRAVARRPSDPPLHGRALAAAGWRQFPAWTHDLRHPRRARSERAEERALRSRLAEFSPLAADLWTRRMGAPIGTVDHHERQLLVPRTGPPAAPDHVVAPDRPAVRHRLPLPAARPGGGAGGPDPARPRLPRARVGPDRVPGGGRAVGAGVGGVERHQGRAGAVQPDGDRSDAGRRPATKPAHGRRPVRPGDAPGPGDVGLRRRWGHLGVPAGAGPPPTWRLGPARPGARMPAPRAPPAHPDRPRAPPPAPPCAPPRARPPRPSPVTYQGPLPGPPRRRAGPRGPPATGTQRPTTRGST